MNRLLRPLQPLARPSRSPLPLRRPTLPPSIRAYPLPKTMNSSTSASSSAPQAAETDTQAAATANATGVTPDSISQRLKDQIAAQHVEIEDISGGCGQSFHALIVSPQFEKKTTIARHRLVNSALKTEIAAIHAWTPRCFTPEEWEKKGAA